MNTNIENGKEYIMYGLNFNDSKLFVNLDLFTAHYLPLETLDSNYVTKSLTSSTFVVRLDLNIETAIKKCLKLRGFNIQAIEMGLLDELIKRYKSRGNKFCIVRQNVAN